MKQQHDEIIKRLTEPNESANVLLHDIWEPWARRILYSGSSLRYLEDCSQLDHWSKFESSCELRLDAVRKYGYAIPSAEALTVIQRVSNGRVIEVGSGTGYWANLLQLRGVDIIAVDTGEEFKPTFFESTVNMDASVYLKHNDGCPDRALFMCWPRDTDEFLAHYRGNTVIWIGEDDGCTGEIDAESGWTQDLEEDVPKDIPNWLGIHDIMRVYRRSESSSPGPTKVCATVATL